MHVSAMGFRDRSCNAQSQPRALFSLIHRRGSPVKALEDPFQLLWCQANAGIRDAQDSPLAVALQGQRHPAASGGVLDTVIHKV